MANETGAERFAKTTPKFWSIAINQGNPAPGCERVFEFAEAYKDSCTQELKAKVNELEASRERMVDGVDMDDPIHRSVHADGRLYFEQAVDYLRGREKAEAEVRELKAQIKAYQTGKGTIMRTGPSAGQLKFERGCTAIANEIVAAFKDLPLSRKLIAIGHLADLTTAIRTAYENGIWDEAHSDTVAVVGTEAKK